MSFPSSSVSFFRPVTSIVSFSFVFLILLLFLLRFPAVHGGIPIHNGLTNNPQGTSFTTAVQGPTTNSLKVLETVYWDVPLADYNDFPVAGDGSLYPTTNLVIDSEGTIYFITMVINGTDGAAQNGITMIPILHAYTVESTNNTLIELWTMNLYNIHPTDTLFTSTIPYTAPLQLAQNESLLILNYQLCCQPNTQPYAAIMAIDLAQRSIAWYTNSSTWGPYSYWLISSGIPDEVYADPLQQYVYGIYSPTDIDYTVLHVLQFRTHDGMLMNHYQLQNIPKECRLASTWPTDNDCNNYQLRFPSPDNTTGNVNSFWLITYADGHYCNIQIDVNSGNILTTDGANYTKPLIANDGNEQTRNLADPTFFLILDPIDSTGRTRYLFTNHSIVAPYSGWEWKLPFPGSAYGGAVFDSEQHLLYVALVQPIDQNPLTSDGIYWDMYVIDSRNGSTVYHGLFPPRPWSTLVGSLIGSTLTGNPSSLTSSSITASSNGTSIIYMASTIASDPDVYERGIQSFSIVAPSSSDSSSTTVGKKRVRNERYRSANLAALIQPTEGNTNDDHHSSYPSTTNTLVTIRTNNDTFPYTKYQRLSYSNPGYTIIDDATFWAIGPRNNMLTILNGYQLQILIDSSSE